MAATSHCRSRRQAAKRMASSGLTKASLGGVTVIPYNYIDGSSQFVDIFEGTFDVTVDIISLRYEYIGVIFEGSRSTEDHARSSLTLDPKTHHLFKDILHSKFFPFKIE